MPGPRCGACLYVLFPGLTGLADGLAQKESRYAETGDSPQRRVPRFPSPAATRRRDGNSAVLTAGIVAVANGPRNPVVPRRRPRSSTLGGPSDGKPCKAADATDRRPGGTFWRPRGAERRRAAIAPTGDSAPVTS